MHQNVREALLTAVAELHDEPLERTLLAVVDVLEGRGDRELASHLIAARKSGIRESGAYTWYSYTGAKPSRLKCRGKNGKTFLLSKGMKFGIRNATSNKTDVRLIVEDLGPTHVFSVSGRRAGQLVKSAKLAGRGGKKKAAAKGGKKKTGRKASTKKKAAKKKAA